MSAEQRLVFTLRFLAALSFVHGICSTFAFAAFLLTSRPPLLLLTFVFLACALATALVHQRVNARASELYREAEARGISLGRN